MTAGERNQDRAPEPEWLHAHVHEPNPEPPSADPAFTLLLPDAKEHIIAARDLARLPQCEVDGCYIVSTGHGTSGPFTFGGVRLVDLVSAYLSPHTRWRDLDVISADGFGNRVAAHELGVHEPGAHEGDRPILLATVVDGRPMTRAQGLVRLMVPSERDDALRQVKWVSRIEIHSEP